MNLRQMLLEDFGFDFPISGGTGNSRDNPIIIHRAIPNNYVGVEHGVLQCIARGRGVNIQFKQQALISHNGRSIDQIKVELSKNLGVQSEYTIENYYFDVTDCLGGDMI